MNTALCLHSEAKLLLAPNPWALTPTCGPLGSAVQCGDGCLGIKHHKHVGSLLAPPMVSVSILMQIKGGYMLCLHPRPFQAPSPLRSTIPRSCDHHRLSEDTSKPTEAHLYTVVSKSQFGHTVCARKLPVHSESGRWDKKDIRDNVLLQGHTMASWDSPSTFQEK